MDLSPLITELHKRASEPLTDLGQFGCLEPVVLAQRRLPLRAVQLKHRLATPPDDVEMGRTVIVGIDHDAQTIDGQDLRHWWRRLP
jgi:hypothetical protein